MNINLYSNLSTLQIPQNFQGVNKNCFAPKLRQTPEDSFSHSSPPPTESWKSKLLAAALAAAVSIVPITSTETNRSNSAPSEIAFLENQQTEKFENAWSGQLLKYAQKKRSYCWFFGGLNTLNNNPLGKEIIKNSVKWNENEKSYSVTFKGFTRGKNIFEVSESEFYDPNNTKMSTGDPGIRILAIATRKLMKENEINQKKEDPLEMGDPGDIISWLGGEEFTVREYYLGADGSNSAEKVKKTFDSLETTNSYLAVGTSCSLKYQTSPLSGGKIPDLTRNPDSTKEIHQSHSYNIVKINKDKQTVEISEPRHPDITMEISYDQFIENFTSLEVFDVAQEQSKP